MRDYRSIPPLDEMPPDYLESGHFWIQEFVLGQVVGVEMDESGLLRFGSRGELLDSAAVPPHLRPAVEDLRSGFDRERLRAGTDHPEAYTFYGVVPLGCGVSYRWHEIPTFLGVDIWDGNAEQYVPEDVTERVYDTIGLATAPTFDKEVPARSFNPRTYAIPDSELADETAAGVVLRKKRGRPARLLAADFDRRHPSNTDGMETELAAWLEDTLTTDTIERYLGDRDDTVRQTDIETLAELVASGIARQEYWRLASVLEDAPGRFETAVGERVRELQTGEFS